VGFYASKCVKLFQEGTEGKKKNQFTKVQMNIEADRILLKYFKNNIKSIEKWFNVISPSKKSLTILQAELDELKNKTWKTIL
jgi:phosphoribosylpyrophosphate synthetase